ncbi:MAG: GWxTD domain-containing protein [Balneolaceae bacterium]
MLKNTVFIAFFLLLLSDIQLIEAQRRGISYQDLYDRSEQPNIYVNQLLLPSKEGSGHLTVSFRIDYDLLPFRKTNSDIRKPDPSYEFHSSVRMNLEVFKGSLNNRRSGFEPVARSSWSDTAWATTYEQTRSRSEHLEGAMHTRLNPGDYSLMLQFNRGETTRESRSRDRNVSVPDFQNTDKAFFAFLEDYNENEDRQVTVRLLNYGENILYGQNFQLMILLPQELNESGYELNIHRLQPGSQQNTRGEPLFRQQITADDLIFTDGFSRLEGETLPLLQFEKQEEGYPVAVIEVPNRQFPNTELRMTLTPEGSTEPIAEKNIHSRWLDMPVSLLNLDIAVNMLRFIVDQDRIRQINRGSASEREEKFRDFWAERDPPPNPEYNELLAEYYRRIDHAYQNFSTPGTPGFETDQGQTYIRMGPPNRRERRFPTDGPTREIWYYNDQTLVFEATTGFGDFRLVGRE